MNPDYKQISTSDAAEMLGVHKTSVTNWCKAGLINFIDVSEPESTRPRYVIPEDEVDKIKRVIKKHGVRAWQKYYKRTPVKFPKAAEDEIVEQVIDEVLSDNVETSEVPKEEKAPSDVDKITNTILYIREIKERLEDLEAEKNQLLNELETLRKEVMDYI